MKQFLAISFLLLMIACTGRTAPLDGEVVLAKVGNEYLYLSDIPFSVAVEDSNVEIEQYRESWIRKQLLVEVALDKVDEEAIDQKVKDYRQSLIWSEYQTLLLDDTNFEASEEEIEAHYEEAKDNFVAQTDQFEVQFFILSADVDVDELKTSLNSSLVPQWLQNYCVTNPLLCRMEKGHWFAEEELRRLTSIPESSLYVTSNFAAYFIDEDLLVIYRIDKIIKEGDTLPLEMIKDKIKELATYQKKQDLIEEITEKTYQTGKTNEAFEVYNY